MIRSLTFALIGCMMCSLVSSLRFQGVVTTSSDYTYIGKFAYGQSGGVFSARTEVFDPVTGMVNNNVTLYGQKLALFPDVAGQWDTIEDDQDLSCDQKVKLAGKTVYNVGYTNQPALNGLSTHEMKLNVSGRRPHFWYVVLVNCQSDASISVNSTMASSIDPSTGLPVVVSVSYTFDLTNGGNMWTNELSWDQQHIAEIAITFLIIYALVFAVVIISLIRSSQSMKSTNQMMFSFIAFIVFCQIMHQILTISYQMEMIHSETIKLSVNQASWWFDTFSQLGLLFSVLILATNNYAIDGMIHRTTMMSFGMIMCVYLLGYIASFVVNVEFEKDHPSLTEWMFNNWGGYLLCAWRIVNIGVIVHYIVQSINNQSFAGAMQPSTRSLLSYGIFVSAWLASFPIITLIASMTSSHWRAKFFYGVNSVVCLSMIICQVSMTMRNVYVMKSSAFKTMDESSKVETGASEVSMSHISRSPNTSNPSSPRSPQSPSQGFRSVAPV